MRHKTFFSLFEDVELSERGRKSKESFTVEELYQAFKARHDEEVASHYWKYIMSDTARGLTKAKE